MANRWDERQREEYGDRAYSGRDRHDRGITDRAGDEVRSWFGDDDAARRRRADELRDDRYARDRSYSDRDWTERASRGGERAWDRARETVRDMTDRDRDGRRGLSEWRDEDRWPDYGYSGRYGVAAEPAGRDWRDDRGRDRAFGDTSRYANADRDWTRTPAAGGAYPTYAPRSAGATARSGYGDAGEWSRGSYAGRGPRGYQRGDDRIREDVCDLLTDDSRIDASDVEVQVSGGEVTLAGSVRTREEKRWAEDIIERISGVREINNSLRVKPTDQVLGTSRSGASVLGLSDTPPPPAPPPQPQPQKK